MQLLGHVQPRWLLLWLLRLLLPGELLLHALQIKPAKQHNKLLTHATSMQCAGTCAKWLPEHPTGMK
jgi:hypothetical protein